MPNLLRAKYCSLGQLPKVRGHTDVGRGGESQGLQLRDDRLQEAQRLFHRRGPATGL
jgi:hypothetical protein